ncbi:hypothetical protein FisN_2Lh585 [Fistulifera solaris]|uniref:Uncharacterized protein n=1 Tax=Fistulifera solaris TaxID=1519565 RepID=A0A1Z5J985_FISSO|nr:hypothetical protein FisN_2Lh585 [Fistulifera solaris]|eukprot:GAX10563.1 hypothetical protein FisN_2Lh585 [Fistulifera solaris]
MTGDKWMTSGANRLKSRMNRSFERRASLGDLPSPRISISHEPSTTTKRHPSFVRRSIRGLTGTYSKWADPLYRRAVTPSSPARCPLHHLHQESGYPPGTILPQPNRDNRATSWHEIPVAANPAFFQRCDPYQDHLSRSPHARLQQQHCAFLEPHHPASYGYEKNNPANPTYFEQQMLPPPGEMLLSCDATYQHQNAAHYQGPQSGDHNGWKNREQFVHYATLPPNEYDYYAMNRDHADVAFSQHCYAFQGDDTLAHQLAPIPKDSERGIAHFRNRTVTFDRDAASMCSNLGMGPLPFERHVAGEHSLHQDSLNCMTNIHPEYDTNDFGASPNIENHPPLDTATAFSSSRMPSETFASCNGENFEINERPDFSERWVLGQSKFNLNLLKSNENFNEDIQGDEFPKGIERFKSRAQDDVKANNKSDSSERKKEESKKSCMLSHRKIQQASMNSDASRDSFSSSKRAVNGVNATEATSILSKEEERKRITSKRQRLDVDHKNNLKENEPPPNENETRLIGAPLAFRFFDDGVEVDIGGRPVDAKERQGHSVKQPPNSSPDPLVNMNWENDESLWG